jgi:cell division septation protein DedD
MNRNRNQNAKAATMILLAALVFAARAAAAPPGSFTVRSAAYVGRNEAVAFAERLGERGFHPVIRTEQSNGAEFHYLEMGVFSNIDQALELVFVLRGHNFDFFVVGQDNPAGQTTRGALVHPDKMARIFPGQAGPAVDQISLLEDIVVNSVPPADQARAWTGGTGPGSGFITSRKMFEFESTAPVAPEVSASALRLRDVAWALRGKGRDVVFEGEEDTTQTGAGVLVGMHDTREQADELARELRGYGYDTLVQPYETADGQKFLVYAQADELAQAIPDSGVTMSKPADTDLLKLQGPSRGRTISPPQSGGPSVYPTSPIGE